MPRKITDVMTLETLRMEIRFTRAALKADPDAADLLPMTNDWIGQLETLEIEDDKVQDFEADGSAAFSVANQRLDDTCIRFGNEKLASVNMNRNATAFTRYFKVAPSEFVDQKLSEQLTSVEAWLTVQDDTVLETHRPELMTWSGRARDAIAAQNAHSQRAADFRVRRQNLADYLTKARDNLHRSLAQRADERGLSRKWPDVFFRKTPPSAPKAKAAEPETK